MTTRFEGTSRFQVLRRLGEGGFGVVYEALDREHDVRVALKTLHLLDAASLFRFKREFRVFADLRHDNLIQLRELVSEGDRWFFTMELVEGVDWLTHVTSTDLSGVPAPVHRFTGADDATMDAAGFGGVGPGGPVIVAEPVRTSVDLGRLRSSLIQVVRGLDALHRAGGCHRDVKPSNILVTGQGRAVLLDFGIATTEDAILTDANAISGTPAYMAPEQVVFASASPASDWYALGVMLYEALTGVLPFSGHPMQVLAAKQSQTPVRPRERAPLTPPELDELCMALLHLSPTQRPTASQILAVLGATPEASAGPATGRTTGGGSVFVGREELLEQLTRAHESSRGGELSLVFLRGTSGAGKSSLLRAFLRQARGQPVVLQGRCLQRESVPYKALDEVIDGLSRYLLGLPREEAARLMPRDAAALARVFPVLDRVPAVAGSPRRADEPRDPYLARSRAFGALRELLGRLTDRSPVVMILDDVQWGDADSASLLAELVCSPRPPPVMLVLSFRAEEEAGSALLGELRRRLAVVGLEGSERRLDIGMLSEPQALTLARQLLGGDDDRACSIARESAGSPFFLEELAQYARTAEGQARAGEIRLDDLIRRRVRQQAAVPQQVLRVLSVAGASLDRRAVRSAGQLDEDALASALGQLRIANLIRLAGARGERVEPFHDKIREAVLEELAPADRVALHRDLALALNALPGTDPETLLVHFRAGGMLDRARPLARTAAEKATEALAFDRAAELWQEALALGGWERDEARAIELVRAEALSRAGRGAQAAEAFLGLAGQAESMAALELRRRAGEELLLAGEMARGTVVIKQVLAAVGVRFPSTTLGLVAAIAAMTAWVRLRGWNFSPRDESELSPLERVRLEVCVSCVRAFSPTELLVSVYFIALLGFYALRSRPRFFVSLASIAQAGQLAATNPGRLDESLAQMDRVTALATEDPRRDELRRTVALTSGVVLSLDGRWAESMARFQGDFGPLQPGGSPSQWDLDTGLHVAFINWNLLGRFDRIAAELPGYLRGALNRGDLYLSTALRVAGAALLWLVRDTPAEGREDIEAALSRWAPTSLDLLQWWGQYSLTLHDLYQGEPGAALDRITRVTEQMRWSRIRLIRTSWYQSLLMAAQCAIAFLALAPGNQARRRVAATWLARARRAAIPSLEPLLRLTSAGVAFLEGRREECRRDLAAAQDAAERLGMAHYVAFCQIRRGQLAGGDEGATAVARGVDALRAGGVVHPARFLQAHSTGFAPLEVDPAALPPPPG